MGKNNNYEVIIVMLIIVLFIWLFALSYVYSVNGDKGSYDYCVEWSGLGGGTLHRDSMIYNCYNLATQEFMCDYIINKETQVLEVKPILNITKVDGIITEIIYDDANYFNCTRWLKSKRG